MRAIFQTSNEDEGILGGRVAHLIGTGALGRGPVGVSQERKRARRIHVDFYSTVIVVCLKAKGTTGMLRDKLQRIMM